MPAGNRDIPRLERYGSAALAAELHLSRTTRDAQYLMYLRMIMHVFINSVAPGTAPAVAFEQDLQYGGCIEFGRQPAPGFYINKRPELVIWNYAVV